MRTESGTRQTLLSKGVVLYTEIAPSSYRGFLFYFLYFSSLAIVFTILLAVLFVSCRAILCAGFQNRRWLIDFWDYTKYENKAID